jgi:hypothetical protein
LSFDEEASKRSLASVKTSSYATTKNSGTRRLAAACLPSASANGDEVPLGEGDDGRGTGLRVTATANG